MNRQTSAASSRRLASGLLAAMALAVAAVGAAALSTVATAWFDEPLPGSHLTLGAIAVTTHATAPDGVNEVTLAVDGVQIASLPFQSERLVTAQFQWQPEQEKGYTLTVRGRSGDVWGEPATVFVVVGPAPTTDGTPPPTPGAATSACQSAPAISEDFSSGSGPFDTFDFGDVAAAVSDGAFHLTFTESGTITNSQAHQSFGDVCVEADVIDVGPERAGRWGVFCRFPEEGTYYEFFVDSSGRAGTRVGSLLTGTSQQPQYFDIAVNTGLGAVNRIRGECIGSTFTMWVNGQVVGSFQEASQAAGDVGLFASTGGASVESGRFDVAFDNFTVTVP